MEHLEGALKMNPAATMVRYPLAMAYRGLGDLERAQSYLDQSGARAGAGVGVTLPDPLMAEVSTVLRSPQVYWDLGLYAGATGDWPEAVKQFRNAVQLAPDSPIVRLNLALALNRVGDARAAWCGIGMTLLFTGWTVLMFVACAVFCVLAPTRNRFRAPSWLHMTIFKSHFRFKT